MKSKKYEQNAKSKSQINNKKITADNKIGMMCVRLLNSTCMSSYILPKLLPLLSCMNIVALG